MKFKLDENIGRRGLDLFEAAGHDAATVAGQDLTSAPDVDLIEICRRESRCLVTLDMQFANPIVFRPENYAGIAVLRLPANASEALLCDAIRTFLIYLAKHRPTRRLWIVELGRVREYQDDSPDEE